MLKVAQIGNFRPQYSTENHLKQALVANNLIVTPIQEDDSAAWLHLGSIANEIDLVLWTRTWSLPRIDQSAIINKCRDANVPVVGYHLDRWFGLGREHEIETEPFFRLCDLMVTADGGNDDKFLAAGINHVWFPPAVDETEALIVGEPKTSYRSDVAFVGSWRNYHPEWRYRTELVERLAERYGKRFRAWPKSPQQTIRGAELNSLYASIAVTVGDSCLAHNATRYWSDRIPETVGRGGFLIHPWVEGIDDHFVDGEHYVSYRLGDWDDLFNKIGYYLTNRDEAKQIAAAGRQHVLQHHTYKGRMRQLLELLEHQGLFGCGPATVGLCNAIDRTYGVRSQFNIREATQDSIVVREQWNEGVYRLAPSDVKDGVVVDIGANIGAVTVWCLAAGAKTVHAYEPDEDNFWSLRQNVKLNGFEALLTNVAVVAEGGTALFAKGRTVDGVKQTGDGSVSAEGDVVKALPFKQVIDVAARHGKGEIALLKIDIEGGEYDIITDPELLAPVRLISMEFHPSPKFGDLVTVLAEWGHVEILGHPSRGGQIYGRRYE